MEGRDRVREASLIRHKDNARDNGLHNALWLPAIPAATARIIPTRVTGPAFPLR